MTRLVIGKESIDIKTAKKKVSNNLKTLNSRLNDLPRDSAHCSELHAFYAKKIDEQTGILNWLNQYDQKDSSVSITAMCA